MLLTYSRLSPWKSETDFKAKIQTQQKIHTFRDGKRWRSGMRIDFWDESPRNTRKVPPPAPIVVSPSCATFWGVFKDKEGNPIEKPLVAAVEDYKWEFWDVVEGMEGYNPEATRQIGYDLWIGERHIDEKLINLVAKRDGFESVRDFVNWFDWSRTKKGVDSLEGQVIHWVKGKVYDKERADIYSHLKAV